MAGLAYKVDNKTVNTTLAYTVPSATNGVGTITFQPRTNDIQLHEDSDFDGDYLTIQGDTKLTFNLRYLEGKTFYFKAGSSTALEIFYFEGLLT